MQGHNLCGCGQSDCKRCKQEAAFIRGRGVSREDRNFLQDGPRLADERQASAFFCLPKEDASASTFKSGAAEYLDSLPEDRRKQAEVFFRR